jgi:Rab GDP dissociation inhibitor
MGIFEKRRCAEFFKFIQQYKQDDPKTHQGFNLQQKTMTELYKQYGLDENTQSFIGHSLALYSNDDYLQRPALETVEKVFLYADSLNQYKKLSPYIYPRYGLGELPQAFARLSAIFGGTYMLDKPIEEILYGPDGHVVGVRSQGEVAKCKMVIADPSYFPDRVKKVGRVIRIICILNHPIPSTNNESSLQIILPQREMKRKNDIYVMAIGSDFHVVPKGKYMAIVSTNVETSEPEKELLPALSLLGPIEQKFVSIIDEYVPTNDGKKDGIFISTTYDGSSHFESTSVDVLNLYKNITGHDMDLTPMKDASEEVYE